jgi:phenylalanyl-tRNA synthetase beta chain
MYCETQFSFESITFVNELNNQTYEYPTLEPVLLKTNFNYLKTLTGVDMTIDEVPKYLDKFGLETAILNNNELEVKVPLSRTDILHPCDVAEDLAIAFGYNNIKKEIPKTICSGFQQPINKLTDIIRNEMAEIGFVECLTFSLISMKDHYERMEIPSTNKNVVEIYGAKTHEFEIMRSSLIPCLLKTIESNMTEKVLISF